MDVIVGEGVGPGVGVEVTGGVKVNNISARTVATAVSTVNALSPLG